MSNSYYKNILVPFDNSKYSQRALEVAKTLARSFDSTLYIATVVDISSVISPGMIKSSDKKAFEQIRNVVKQSARDTIRRKGEECVGEEIKTRESVLEGSVVNELLKLIEESHIDVVVIGSKGLSGLSKIKALGSISRKISELADCPVIIIH